MLLLLGEECPDIPEKTCLCSKTSKLLTHFFLRSWTIWIRSINEFVHPFQVLSEKVMEILTIKKSTLIFGLVDHG